MRHFLLNRAITLFATISVLLVPRMVISQDDTVRLSPRIELNYFQVNGELPYLTTRVRVKKDSRWEPVKWVIVNLFLNEETKLGMMGNATTNIKGEGSYILPAKFKPAWDSLDQYTFIARIKSDDKVRDTKKVITIKRSNLKVETNEQDSTRKILITIQERQRGKWENVSDLELKAFINRHFGKLIIGEDTYTTDENGAVSVSFEASIPGDDKGVIAVGATIEDNDDYGNLTTTQNVAWGLPLEEHDDFFAKRTLWSTRDKAPIWLLIFPNFVIFLVWGVIAYLFYNVLILKRIYRNSLKQNA